MPQPFLSWYFEPEPVAAGTGRASAAAAVGPGLGYVSAEARQRHGARLLDPSDAATIAGSRRPDWDRPPNSTVYRARTLLIPADLLGDAAVVAAIDGALASVGMRLVPPGPDGRPVRSEGPAGQALRRLPRIAGLAPSAPAPGRPAVPVVVDAWIALQALRAAAEATTIDDSADVAANADGYAGAYRGGTGERRPVLTPEVVGRIGLEHLLVGSSASPSAFCEGNDVEGAASTSTAVGVGSAGVGSASVGSVSGRAIGDDEISGSPFSEGNAVSAPGGAGSYVYGGGQTRTPVALFLRAPGRRPPGALGCRRPVVAVLDSGVRAHPWLDVRPDPAGGYLLDPADGFVADDPAIQAGVRAESSFAAAQQGDASRHVITDAWDGPAAGDPLLGELNEATGHGTFIAGIVRQAAPDSQVLSIRIMHSDDVVYEGDLICALALLADRIAAAEDGGMAAMVDVVSLSLGYFDESAADDAYTSGLWLVIQVLLDLGVTVVAAAGNYSTTRPFYPAAFSLRPSPVPVISVGALNPNGSRALFSDGGRWVRAWAAGAAVVSCYPDDVNGSLAPPVLVDRPAVREALDPDDFRGGFAAWSGTSFAAPLIAAKLVARLLEQATGPGLDATGCEAATDRTLAALASLGWPGTA
jgi:hypothetical protein